MGKMGQRSMRFLLGMLMGLFIFCTGTQANAMALNVQNADVSELLRSVARMGGINLIIDESVSGQVSLKLDDAQPEEIIQNVVKARGFALTKEGSTWIVAGESRLQRGFASVHVIPVQYAPLEDLKEAAELFLQEKNRRENTTSSSKKKASTTSADSTSSSTESKKSSSSRTSYVQTDVSTGSLLVYGTVEEAMAVEELVKKLDVPAKQISIEAKVVSINKEDASKLGIQWDWTSLPQYNYTSVSTESDGNRFTVTRPTFDSGTAGGIISFGKGPEGKPYEWQFSATMEALVTHGKADVLSRPNVVTLQGHEAVINIGGEVPVPTVSTTNSTVTTSIEYRPAGIILRCLPMVSDDGYITSKIHTEVSSPSYVEEMKAYSFQKRSADTTVRLKNGETMVIGGLISSEEAKSISKVPFLGDLPILGNFFKSVRKSKTNSEIFIILKAEIVP